jgi:hypothetical protein
MSEFRERKASFYQDQNTAPNQLNYSTNFMSYKGNKRKGFYKKGMKRLTFKKGAWLSTILIVIVIKILYSLIPFITSETSWTLTNLTYNIVSFFLE